MGQVISCAAVVICSGLLILQSGTEQEAAIAEIEKLGGQFTFEPNEPGKKVRILYLQGKGITDRDIALVRALPELKRLDLQNSRVTDEGLKTLSKMPELEALYLRNTSISEKAYGLKRVKP